MSTGKNPWMKFYPSDWRADPALRMCSLAARGLWIEMMTLMHEAEPYGHLLVRGKAPTEAQLAMLVGASLREVEALIGELEAAGVFSRSGRAVVVSRRMVRDEKKARTAQRNGKAGGNPSLLRKRENPVSVNPDAPPEVKAGGKAGDNTQKPEARDQSPEKQKGCDGPMAPATQAAALIAAFDDARSAVWGEAQRRPWPAATDLTAAVSALTRGQGLGLTPEQTAGLCAGLFRQRMAALQAKGQAPPQSLRFFEQAIADVLAAAVAPPPATGVSRHDTRPDTRPDARRSRRADAAADADRDILAALGLAPERVDPG